MRKDVYQTVTDFMIKKLKDGIVPWQKPWNTPDSYPRNIRGRMYRGINLWTLTAHNYQSPFWLTFKQVKDLGGTVTKGEKGTTVVFWKMLSREDEEGETKRFPFLAYYTVFNLDQTTDIPEDKIPVIQKTEELDFNPINKAEEILYLWDDKPNVEHGKAHACYIPAWDKIEMPDKKYFKSVEEYYSTLFHEYIHSTGHKSRTNRHASQTNHKFGSKDYSKEELVAEMGAAFLCGITGIENKTINNSAAYIQSWIQKLRNDKKFLIHAAGLAQKACDHILQPEFETETA